MGVGVRVGVGGVGRGGTVTKTTVMISLDPHNIKTKITFCYTKKTTKTS